MNHTGCGKESSVCMVVVITIHENKPSKTVWIQYLMYNSQHCQYSYFKLKVCITY